MSAQPAAATAPSIVPAAMPTAPPTPSGIVSHGLAELNDLMTIFAPEFQSRWQSL